MSKEKETIKDFKQNPETFTDTKLDKALLISAIIFDNDKSSEDDPFFDTVYEKRKDLVTPDFIYDLIKEDGSFLTFLNEYYPKLVDEELILLAAEENADNISKVPVRYYKDEDFVLKLVKTNPETFYQIKPPHMTAEAKKLFNRLTT